MISLMSNLAPGEGVAAQGAPLDELEGVAGDGINLGLFPPMTGKGLFSLGVPVSGDSCFPLRSYQTSVGVPTPGVCS